MLINASAVRLISEQEIAASTFDALKARVLSRDGYRCRLPDSQGQRCVNQASSILPLADKARTVYADRETFRSVCAQHLAAVQAATTCLQCAYPGIDTGDAPHHHGEAA